MLERGVQVAKPLGRLFIDDMEFALFQWVVGKRLDSLYFNAAKKEIEITPEGKAVWEAYGRFVRFCHNNGIALDDAAGRNAIWNGISITGIDFEHTWISKDVTVLGWADRRTAVERIRRELGGALMPLYQAFRIGYNALD